MIFENANSAFAIVIKAKLYYVKIKARNKYDITLKFSNFNKVTKIRCFPLLTDSIFLIIMFCEMRCALDYRILLAPNIIDILGQISL